LRVDFRFDAARSMGSTDASLARRLKRSKGAVSKNETKRTERDEPKPASRRRPTIKRRSFIITTRGLFFQRELLDEAIFRNFFRRSGGAVPTIDTMRKARRRRAANGRRFGGNRLFARRRTDDVKPTKRATGLALRASSSSVVEERDDGESG